MISSPSRFLQYFILPLHANLSHQDLLQSPFLQYFVFPFMLLSPLHQDSFYVVLLQCSLSSCQLPPYQDSSEAVLLYIYSSPSGTLLNRIHPPHDLLHALLLPINFPLKPYIPYDPFQAVLLPIRFPHKSFFSYVPFHAVLLPIRFPP